MSIRARSLTAVTLVAVLALTFLLPTTIASWLTTTTNPTNAFSTAARWPGSQTFGFTAVAQQFTVPYGYTEITVEAWGAQGGGGNGGRGGYARTTLPVVPGTTLEVRVGQRPDDSVGGSNGGGDGGDRTISVSPAHGGGGASDVRPTDAGLESRLIVAAGGGGQAGNASGGVGGGDEGSHGAGAGVRGGRGATRTGGGAAGTGAGTEASPGQQGVGGAGSPGSIFCASGGGGGGGYWGGGGGACGSQDGALTQRGGGGGGSSFTGGTDATDPRTVAGVRTGHGQVIIHWGTEPELQGP